MTKALKERIVRASESCWKPYRKDSDAESECTDVLNYWLEAEEPKDFGPLRYVAMRIRRRQGELFADGQQTKYFAVMCGTGKPNACWNGIARRPAPSKPSMMCSRSNWRPEFCPARPVRCLYAAPTYT